MRDRNTLSTAIACFTLLRHPFLRCIRWRSVSLAAVAALAGLLPLTGVQAHHVEDMCTRSDSGTLGKSIYIPINTNMGSDVQVGEAFGPWYPYTITWTCVRTAIPAPPDKHAHQPPNDHFEVKTEISPKNLVDMGNFQGDPSFRIYGYAGYNVGLIAKVEQEVEGGSADATHINHLPIGTKFVTNLADAAARKHGDVSRFHLTLQVRLVKLPGVTPAQDALWHPFTIDFWSISRHPGSAPYWKHISHYYNYVKLNINNVNATCTTPNVHVSLFADSAKLNKVNDTGPIKDFNLRFENCPKGLTSVAYKFQSVPLQPIVNGILPRDPGLSTASGVSVQVLKENGTPQLFNETFIPLTGYDAVNPSPLYQVPMKARIIRTTGPLQGGTVHAAMKMVVRYQ